MPQAHSIRKPEQMLKDGAKLAPLRRALTLDRKKTDDSSASTIPGFDPDARTLTFTFSSEQPVQRWFGAEVLSHDPGSADLTRLNDSAPLLFNHNMDDVLGVVERAGVNGSKQGECTVRFAKTARGDEVMGMVADGILRNVSFMYQALAYRIESDEEDPYYDDDAIYTATKWQAFEVSIVTVPADQTVGIGRAASTQERSVSVETRRSTHPSAIAAPTSSKGNSMTPEEQAALAARNAEIAAAGDTALKDERKRVEDIVALGRSHSLPLEQVQGMIARGLDIGAARGEVLANILARGQSPAAALSGTDIGLTDKEKRKYSYLRALQAQLSKSWEKAGFEREVSAAIAKRDGKDTAGFFLPNDLPFCPDEEHLRAWNMMSQQGKTQLRAPYQVGTAGQGGNLVQTQLLYENFVEVLRNQLVTAILGARYLTGLVGNIDIPRQISQTGTYWVAESSAPTEAEATFDKVSLRPKTIGALSKMSRLMLLQSTPAIEMLARQDLLAVIALAVDAAALSGPGTGNAPTGIVNQSGVASVVGGANGLAISFDHLIQLKYATKFANAPQGAAGYAMNSKTIGSLSTLKATTGQYLWDPQGGLTAGSPDRVKGSPYAESQQLRTTLTKGTSTGNCSELIYGNWQELFIAMWGVTEIMLNPYDAAGFTTGDVLMRAFQTCDVGVRHGASFAVMSDALTPGF